jgi:DMSO/TMAO reductase YedYZ molybdopterin-dependent catalytic subunit
VKHHCVEGWSAIATWTGFPFHTLADMVGVRPAARYVQFDSFDAGFYNGWDLESALHPQTILAYRFNDKDLMPDHGAPLRLYAPHKLGYKLTKYLTRITFTDERPGGYWEDQGYPWYGEAVRDSLMDVMPGGEMARGDSAAAMELLKHKM